MSITMPLGRLDYRSIKSPANYVCGQCGASGVKLWRRYQSFLENQNLFCLPCACNNQGVPLREPTEDGHSLYTGVLKHWYRTAKHGDGWWSGYDPCLHGTPEDAIELRTERERHDSIRWLIPAIPTVEGDTFWGYSSVPQDGCEWWYRLPARAAIDPK